jgi:hypothetical protein
VLQPAAAVARSAAPEAHGGPPEPPAEPVIEVTIGRVEVRAVTPPVTEKRQAAPSGRLSLAEYLRRRPGAGG